MDTDATDQIKKRRPLFRKVLILPGARPKAQVRVHAKAKPLSMKKAVAAKQMPIKKEIKAKAIADAKANAKAKFDEALVTAPWRS